MSADKSNKNAATKKKPESPDDYIKEARVEKCIREYLTKNDRVSKPAVRATKFFMSALTEKMIERAINNAVNKQRVKITPELFKQAVEDDEELSVIFPGIFSENGGTKSILIKTPEQIRVEKAIKARDERERKSREREKERAMLFALELQEKRLRKVITADLKAKSKQKAN